MAKIPQTSSPPPCMAQVTMSMPEIGIKFPSQWPDPTSQQPQILECSNLEGLLMMDPKFEQLQTWWWLRFKDIMAPMLERLPSYRGVNHWINLINPSSHHIERQATCPQVLEDQLGEKLACYKHAQWWVHHPIPIACPLLCIAKKDGSTHLKEENYSSVERNSTPMPQYWIYWDVR